MNLNYIICKCKGFGYSDNFTNIKLKKISDENTKIYYFHEKEADNKEKYINITNLDEFYENMKTTDTITEDSLFIVELGLTDKVEDKLDVEIDNNELFNIVDREEIDLDINDELKNKYRECLKSMIEKPTNFTNSNYNMTFLEYLKSMYKKFEDSKIQKTIIKILNFNGVRTDKLLSEFPIKYRPIENESTRKSNMFSDLKITDPFFEHKDEIETETNEILRHAEVNKILQFNGFGNTFSRIDNSKTNINNKNNIQMRNYEVINMLTRNKIVSEPIVQSMLSINKLMKSFEKFSNFKVIFIWPEFTGFVFANVPSNVVEVDSPGCVILNVIFRYVCIYFFGMYTTYNNEDKFNKYLI